MNKEYDKYLESGKAISDAIESQMFGKPCFKLNGKAFISFFNNCMVFKLRGDEHQEALSLNGSCLFDPSGKGRPMKEWVQVPYLFQEKWSDFAQNAAKYVGSLNK